MITNSALDEQNDPDKHIIAILWRCNGQLELSEIRAMIPITMTYDF